jgi:uncharacterized membrane-anchored protein
MDKKKGSYLILFIIVMATYLLIPYGMISRYETVLHEGNVFRFRPEPVDPYDAFRGKYIELNGFNNRILKDTSAARFEAGDNVFVTVKKSAVGYAFFADVSKTKPETPDYISTKVERVYNGSIHSKGKNEVFIQVPFERYYMNENYADKTEGAYRDRTRNRDTTDIYLDVRIRNGVSIIEELYLSGMPAKEFMRQKVQDK